MIFSLGEKPALVKIPPSVDTDYFLFASVDGAVRVPSEVWWESICASLRMKKRVIVLEENCQELPQITSGRWGIGDKSFWLSPRSLNVISEAFKGKTINLQVLYSLLETLK
jgi:hypothetical protein